MPQVSAAQARLAEVQAVYAGTFKNDTQPALSTLVPSVDMRAFQHVVALVRYT